jgi:hypothetical protein
MAAFAATVMVAGLAATTGTGQAAAGTVQELARRLPIETSRPASRPFDHGRHEDISCRSCHGSGASHRQLLVRSARDCAACHHSADMVQGCNACHADAQLAATRAVEVAVTVAGTRTTRVLPFDHIVHLRADRALQCRDCHVSPVTLAVERQCVSCHDRHHRPDATCANCHATIEQSVHVAETHLSCAAAGCHSARVVPAPGLSRSVCLACHVEMKAHRPDQPCAQCHQIPLAEQGTEPPPEWPPS